MSNNAVSIIPMSLRHAPDVVSIHLASFPGFFLSFLGPRFLSLYYRGVCLDPEGICLVCLNDAGLPVGFVAGATNPRGFYSRLLKRYWVRFSFASLGAIVRQPTVIRRIARGILYPRDNPVGDHVAGLFSIGVIPELQGIGLGRKLINSFLLEAKRGGCNKVFLTTDRDNNDSANRFYQLVGFTVARHYETPEGRRMNEYWISLSE